MDLLDAIGREAQTAFSDFDENAVWTPAGGSATAIKGIFDRVSEVTDIGEMLSMDGVAAMLNVPDVAIPGLSRDDGIVVRGYTYRVVAIEPDGTGRTMLILGI